MMRLRSRALAPAAAMLLLPLGAALAQCPDGTPPPCRGAAAAPAGARRPAPPLDDRTWIVVPFENVARVSDIDWLRDASVNLLYLDMSKWRDIRVIDDERVADLIREVPEARGGAQLTLQSGIAVAKRAGAGKLVMGDLLKVGTRTQVVGKVFDVRTGQRLRTVRQETSSADSIMGVFGQLARGVLNVEPPPGTSLGTIGTSSVGAYQAYIAGVGFLNRWMLDSAHAQFDKALSQDSTFALAHYKLALVYGWESPNDPAGPRHAGQALRLGTGLPARERALVAGYAAFTNGRWPEACRFFEGVIRADSNDVEGWYNLGECTYHDQGVEPVPGDTTRFVFRTSWNTMLRAFRRTLELDPTYHLAFQHIQDALLTSARPGCRLSPDGTGCIAVTTGNLSAVLLRDADSLVTVPVANTTIEGAQAFALQKAEAQRIHSRRQNLLEAKSAAEAWLAAGPGESRPRLAYGRILLRLGQVKEADSLLQTLPLGRTSKIDRSNSFSERAEVALKLGRGAEAARLIDSLRTLTDPIPQARQGAILQSAAYGKIAALSSMVESAVAGPDWVKKYYAQQARAFVGAPTDSVIESEAEFLRKVTASQGAARASLLVTATFLFTDPAVRRGRWPAIDTTNGDPRLVLNAAVASGDTSRIRLSLTRFDSIAGSLTDEADNGFALVGAYAHLAIADTAGALRALIRFRDVTWNNSPALDQLSPGFSFAGMAWARTFLLLGDLAAASGRKDDAVRAYRLFIGMWEGADPELQPIVDRARKALAGLGG